MTDWLFAQRVEGKENTICLPFPMTHHDSQKPSSSSSKKKNLGLELERARKGAKN